MRKTESHAPAWLRPATIALSYVVIAAAWILVSGLLFDWLLGRDGNARSVVEQVKGLAFVGVTGIALWLALKRYVGSIFASSARAERLAQFPMLSPNPVVEMTEEGAILTVNRAAEVEGGRDGVASILPGDFARIARECIATGQPKSSILVHRSGRTWEWTVFPVRNPDGAYAYGVERTEQERLQAQVQQAARMESVGRMAAGVSHDLNNILTAIGGYASLAEMEEAAGKPVAEEIAGIRAEVARAALLVKKLLSVSRMRRPQSDVRRVDLSALVEGLGGTLRHLVPARVRLVVDAGQPPAWVELDMSDFEQALLNLVANAVDAIDGEGSVTVAAEGSPAGRQVTVAVEDDGHGIADEVLPRVFDPFFTTKEDGRGTGLGLASVQAFVERSHGTMRIETRPGGGTRVVMSFPVAAAG